MALWCVLFFFEQADVPDQWFCEVEKPYRTMVDADEQLLSSTVDLSAQGDLEELITTL